MKLVIDFGKKEDKKKLFEVLQTRKPKNYIVDIKEAREKRSLDQNKYYWVCIGIISKETGNDPMDMHFHFKAKFLGETERHFKQTGEVFRVPNSSSTLDTSDFSKYLESVRLFAIQDLNIYIPTPDEYMKHQIELNTQYLND